MPPRKKAATTTREVPASEMIKKTETMVHMLKGPYYETCGVTFTKESPFQLMHPADAERLIREIPERFREAKKEDVQEFYSLTK